MEISVLKYLKNKWRVVGWTVDVIKYVYSVRHLSRHYPGSVDSSDENSWCSYSYKAALNRQRTEILKELKYIRKNKSLLKHKIKQYFFS